MTLDEAIEVLELRVASPFVKANTDTKDATELGIEALKKIKYDREPGNRPLYSRLPGETEE